MHQNLTANTILNNYISILCQYFVNTFLFFCYIKWKLKLCFFNFNFVSFFYWSKESNIIDNLGCRPTFGILRKENVQKSCSYYCLDKTDFYGGVYKGSSEKDRPYCYQLFFWQPCSFCTNIKVESFLIRWQFLNSFYLYYLWTGKLIYSWKTKRADGCFCPKKC